MITIVNVSPDPKPTGTHKYEVRVNQEVKFTFMHRREFPLSTLLHQAYQAAIEHEHNKEGWIRE